MKNLVFIKTSNVRGSVAFNGALIPIDDGMFSEHLKNVLHLSILYLQKTALADFSPLPMQ